jgi:hypothetical protein
MEINVACIVEGHGDQEAVPILVRRIAERALPQLTVRVPPALRIPKSKLLKTGEIERAVDLAARKAGRSGAVLVVVDSDEDCPAQMGPQLLRRAQLARPDVPVAVILAKREFEAWFLAACESLRGKRGLAQELHAPTDPEAIRGAKEWLSRHMSAGFRYSEALDQPALAACLDLDQARRAPSFDKLYRDVRRALAQFAM